MSELSIHSATLTTKVREATSTLASADSLDRVGPPPDQPPGSLMLRLVPGTHQAYWLPEDLA